MSTTSISIDSNKKHFFSICTVFFILFCSSLISIILLLDENKPYYFELLPLMPLSFGVVSSIFYNSLYENFKSFSFSIFYFVYSIRMMIIPFTLYLSNYDIQLGDYNTILDYSNMYKKMDYSIILSIYELIVVFLLLKLFTSQRKYPFKLNQDNKFETVSKTLKRVILISLFIIIILSIVYSSLTDYFSFFVETSQKANYIKQIELNNLRKEIPSLPYWIFVTLIKVLQMFIPILLIKIIYKLIGHKKRFIGIFLSFLVVVFTFSLMTPEKINSVAISIVLLIILSKIYKIAMKKIIILLGLLIIFALVGLLYKSGIYNEGKTVTNLLSSTLNAYFSGIVNISLGSSMNQKQVTWEIIFSDIINSVPFMSYYFKDMLSTPEVFNEYIKGEYTQVTKIIPMISQGQYYFTFLFAPIFSVLSVLLSVHYERKLRSSNEWVQKYVFLYGTIYFAISPIMYNFNIALNGLIFILIYIVIIQKPKVGSYDKNKKIYKKY